MASQPTVYMIQARDAFQHSGKLLEILQNLETENRISGFTALGPDDDLSSVSDTLKKEDMVLILLTSELEGKREQIKKRVSALKSDQPGLRVAEILVDNVFYDNEFVTFPDDLRPIREREDMDSVWGGIEKSLKNMFTASSSATTNTTWWASTTGLFALFVVSAGFFIHHDLPGLLGLIGIPIAFITLALVRPIEPWMAAAFVFGVSTVAFLTEPFYKLLHGMRLQSSSDWLPQIVLIIVIYTLFGAAICWWKRFRLMRD